MSRTLKKGILGASTITLSKDIDKCDFICGSDFNETDVMVEKLSTTHSFNNSR